MQQGPTKAKNNHEAHFDMKVSFCYSGPATEPSGALAARLHLGETGLSRGLYHHLHLLCSPFLGPFCRNATQEKRVLRAGKSLKGTSSPGIPGKQPACLGGPKTRVAWPGEEGHYFSLLATPVYSRATVSLSECRCANLRSFSYI